MALGSYMCTHGALGSYMCMVNGRPGLGWLGQSNRRRRLAVQQEGGWLGRSRTESWLGLQCLGDRRGLSVSVALGRGLCVSVALFSIEGFSLTQERLPCLVKASVNDGSPRKHSQHSSQHV